MTRDQVFRLIEVASVMLFFFQALRVIFSVLFGIIYDGVFEGPFTAWLVISLLLVVIAFLSPMLVSKRLHLRHLSTLAVITALFRITLSINVAEFRFWGALATIFVGGIYLGASLRILRPYASLGFVSALCLDQFFRILGHTYDVGLRSIWVPFQILWVVSLYLMGRRLAKVGGDEAGATSGLSLGQGLALGSFLFLQTSLLSLPNAMVHWSGGQYEVVAPLLFMTTCAFLLPFLSLRLTPAMSSNRIARIFSVVFILLGIMAGYFLTGFIAVIGLLLAAATSIGLLFYSLESSAEFRSKPDFAFSMALILFLILNFINAFAFTYPYTLPALRDLGWAVYLAAAIISGLVIFSRKPQVGVARLRLSSKVLLPLLGVLLVAVVFVWPIKATDLPEGGKMRIATYNIHYGYDDDWRFTLEHMAKTIEENDCDVVAMQEVDTGRMTSYSVDDAYYLARRLKMQVAYLPTVEHLTGIGILYRGPKVDEEMQLLSSLQEQTGIIGLALGDKSKPLNIYGIWLGLSNEDTLRQISEGLDFIGGRTPAAFGGDFNARYEDPEAEAIREAGFIDPFTQLGVDPIPNTSPAIQPKDRIDFVWIRDLTPTRAWVSESLASDHRMVVVEVDYRP